jgi:ethanolamine ammonia-lyase large subunit
MPGADDVMLNYQSTSFHDALYLRRLLKKGPAPEFEAWLERMGLCDGSGNMIEPDDRNRLPSLMTPVLELLA